MREQLLGYLMGALDASQQVEVEKALEVDPQLRQELELLHRALEPLRADRGLYEPPCGLADRALDAVASVAGWPEDGDGVVLAESVGSREECEPETAPPAHAPSLAAGRSRPVKMERDLDAPARPWGARWALLDVAVSAGILASAAVLFFPAVANSRFQARVTACQDHLRTIGEGLDQYSANHQNQFVAIPEDGKLSFAGIYSSILHDEGYVDESSVFSCVGNPSPEHRVPRVSEIERAVGAELRRLQRLAGGSYGYNLGYLADDGRYSPARNRRRENFALLADAPAPSLAGRSSLNHEGRGHNVVFEDGHIQFVTSCSFGDDDNIFASDRGLVEAGQNPDDAVIGSSHARPLPWAKPFGSR